MITETAQRVLFPFSEIPHEEDIGGMILELVLSKPTSHGRTSQPLETYDFRVEKLK